MTESALRSNASQQPEVREGISPLVIEICCVCSHMIDYCECACEAPTGASHD